MKKWIALILALALSASLLAGCGSQQSAEETEAEAAAEEAIAEVAEATMTDTEKALVEALDACTELEPGSAGNSLKTLGATVNLVEAIIGVIGEDLANLKDAITLWYEELPQEKKDAMTESWNDVTADVEAILNGDGPILEMLSENGFELDLSGLDLSKITEVLTAITESITK